MNDITADEAIGHISMIEADLLEALDTSNVMGDGEIGYGPTTEDEVGKFVPVEVYDLEQEGAVIKATYRIRYSIEACLGSGNE